jgi:uncharacterized OsmC-like protein
MSELDDYLRIKKPALDRIKAAAVAPGYAPQPLQAKVTAEGRSGIRRIRIRDFQVITDSPPSFVGFDLGPSSPELVLGALGSCLNHSFLIQAAAHGLKLDALEVEVTGQIDQRAGTPGNDGIPFHPHRIAYVFHVTSPASAEEIETVRAAVERSCPILNLIRRPQEITASLTIAREHRLAAE